MGVSVPWSTSGLACHLSTCSPCPDLLNHVAWHGRVAYTPRHIHVSQRSIGPDRGGLCLCPAICPFPLALPLSWELGIIPLHLASLFLCLLSFSDLVLCPSQPLSLKCSRGRSSPLSCSWSPPSEATTRSCGP